MGLLDAILGGMMGGRPGGSMDSTGAAPGMPGGGGGALLQMLLQMLQQNGGLGQILGRMQQSGYGQQAQSWIGTGQNLPIDPAALQEIFGHGQLGQIAQQLGISHEEASTGVAQMLPQVVDRMSPDGQLPDNHSDLVNDALAILQRGQR